MNSIVSIAKTSDNSKIFIPTRSYYAKYISENSSHDSDLLQYLWLKLFSEETAWNSSRSYYSAGFSNWASKYYSDYVGMDGIIHSSKGKTITYSTEFDSFLYQTILHNDDFIINWINNSPAVFKQYCKTASSHPIFSKAIIDLTAGTNPNTNFLGNGQYATNNLILRGAASSATDKHKGNGTGPKWNVSASKATGYDLDILRVLGCNYSKLNPTQKAWVKTYFSWLVEDYISYRNKSLAYETSGLMNLIAVSFEAFNSSNPQLFFNHCITNRDVNVGEFIANSATAYGRQNDLYSGIEDVSSNSDMSTIWDLSDGDCYYTNGNWAGYRTPAGQTPDNDYDWLCYRICFDKSTYWTKLKTLVATNQTTNSQMEDWIMRYNAKGNSSGSNSMSDAIAHAGETVSETINNATWSGCGKVTPEPVIAGDGSIDHYRDITFWCPIHGTDSIWVKPKPMGVKTISFSIPTHGKNVDSTISYRIYDTATGVTISEGKNASKNTTISLNAKYVWSSTVVIEGTTHYKDGNEGQVGNGRCDSVHKGSTTINFTYADVSSCVKNGHVFNWTYDFYDENGNILTDADKTSVPAYCIANGVCADCGHKTHYNDMQLKKSVSGNNTLYTATFAHASGSNLGSKTRTVYPANTTVGPTIFSASSNSNYLSASANLTNFGASQSITKTYTGDGNSVQLVTSAAGTVALKSGAITKGAKSITVSATGHDNIYTLMNPITGELKNSRRELMASSGASTCTWNLADYSDEELDGVYVIVEMYSRDENKSGHALGDKVSCTSTVRFEYIKVSY